MKLDFTLAKINENDICAEIGVWRGNSSEQILTRKPSELHLIDPWTHQEDVIDRCYSKHNQKKMDDIYTSVKNRFKNTKNVTIHRKFSTEVSFPNKYFDWVYIDADHSYAAVLRDLHYYYPLIKSGGYMCGDDYGLWSNRPKTGWGSDGGGGPKPAVDEFVETKNLKLQISRRQFIIEIN